jgi:hypothetical protein
MTDEEFQALLSAVKGKRSKVVIQHLLEHGFITTEDLEKTYGYAHPPRAIRDVREQGIPLESFSTKDSVGRTIAAYRFADYTQLQHNIAAGRRTFSKQFKHRLYEGQNGICAICSQQYEERYLQIDHRVPYQVAGDTSRDPKDFMLICGSCNRAKSWSCEHCRNWLIYKRPELCLSCYWAQPTVYLHIALVESRRVDLQWSGEEITTYDMLVRNALAVGLSLADYIKALLRETLNRSE